MHTGVDKACVCVFIFRKRSSPPHFADIAVMWIKGVTICIWICVSLVPNPKVGVAQNQRVLPFFRSINLSKKPASIPPERKETLGTRSRNVSTVCEFCL